MKETASRTTIAAPLDDVRDPAGVGRSEHCDDRYSLPTNPAVSMYKTPKHALLVVVKAGIAKAVLLWWQVMMLGWHAGVFVGFGAGLTLIVNSSFGSIETSGDMQITIPVPAGIRKLIAGALFPIGLVLVVLNGSELFTGNIMYLLASKLAGKISWIDLAKNWTLTYFGNLAGSLAVAYFLFHETEFFKGNDEYLFHIAEAKTKTGMWWVYFLKGVGCNYLVCMALWGAACADDVVSKITALWWPIFGFVAIGFEHCVANMFYIPMAMMEGYDINTNAFIARNLVPVTLGNIVGAVLYILVQFVIYHPYIPKDVANMHLSQGGKHMLFSRKESSGTGPSHSIPDSHDTLCHQVASWLAGLGQQGGGHTAQPLERVSRHQDLEMSVGEPVGTDEIV